MGPIAGGHGGTCLYVNVYLDAATNSPIPVTDSTRCLPQLMHGGRVARVRPLAILVSPDASIFENTWHALHDVLANVHFQRVDAGASPEDTLLFFDKPLEGDMLRELPPVCRSSAYHRATAGCDGKYLALSTSA